MAHLAPNYEERQEFWKPVVPPREENPPDAQAAEAVCPNCGTGVVVGSRFCHVCGNDRQATVVEETPSRFPAWLDLAVLRDVLGQNTASLIALVLGFACVIAAAVTGLLYTATTLLDWQAIQVWRIEWLLAAVALFVAGLLLKKK